MFNPSAPLKVADIGCGTGASTIQLARLLNAKSWVWFLEEIDEKTTRLIVRVRSDYNPGLLSTLSTGIPNELGSLVMQPKTLLVLKQRAEMSVR